MTVSGAVTSLVINWSAAPIIFLVTNSSVLSEPLLLLVIGFLLIAAYIAVFIFLLPTSAVQPSDELIEGRGFLYYSCCLFMWGSVTSQMLLAGRLQIFGDYQNTKYYSQWDRTLPRLTVQQPKSGMEL